MIKKILVPIDFSTVSGYAMKEAFSIAKKMKSEISFWHNMEENESREEIDSKIKDINKDHYNKSIITSGYFIKNLKNIVDQDEYDLIVMGSHGSSGVSQNYMGSNAQKVVRHIHTNVLVVKTNRTGNYKKVLFASDFHENEKLPFLEFLKFMENYNISQLDLMAVNTSGFFSQPSIIMKEVMEDYAEMARPIPVSTHFYTDFTVEKGIRHFSEENGVDLIAISNIGRSPLKRIFQGSNVEMIVNQSNIPVLCLSSGKK